MTEAGNQPPEEESIGVDTTPLLLASLEHSWKWFDFWKNRRGQLYNLYLIALAFLTAGYFTAIGAHRTQSAVTIAIAGILAAILCGVVDGRIAKYDRVGEDALAVLQSKLAGLIDCPELKLVELARSQTAKHSFRLVVMISFAIGIIAWIVAVVYASMRP